MKYETEFFLYFIFILIQTYTIFRKHNKTITTYFIDISLVELIDNWMLKIIRFIAHKN